MEAEALTTAHIKYNMYLAELITITPTQLIPLNQLVEQGELKQIEARVYEKLLGLKTIARFKKTTPQNVITQLFKKLMSMNKIEKENIEYIILCHTGESIFPKNNNILEILKEKYDLKNAKLLSSSTYKCATIFACIQLLKSLFKNLKKEKLAIILTVDTCFTKVLKTIPGTTVMGEAGALLILSNQKNLHHIIDVLVDSNGQFSKTHHDYQQQIAFQSVYIKYVCNLIAAILSKNNLLLPDIKMIFPHNVNTLSWKNIAKALAIPVEKLFLDNVNKTGHCFGADPFINLSDG